MTMQASPGRRQSACVVQSIVLHAVGFTQIGSAHAWETGTPMNAATTTALITGCMAHLP
jgi:hypothetical protein